MIFTEFRFLFFFLVVFVVYWGLPKHGLRKLWLLAASIAFYGAWDWRFVPLIFVPTIIDYFVALKIEQSKSKPYRKNLLIFSLVSNLGILAYFKYCNFFIESAVSFSAFMGIPFSASTLQIILPIGISFYTFHTLSYTIDVYWRRIKPVKNIFDFALAICFFPQMVAGPIVRASFFLPQIKKAVSFSSVDVRACLTLFLIGFFKKACISDQIAPYIDEYFSNPALYDAHSAWLAVIGYAIQIYCDFSGYSEMAMGVAGLLGFKLPENFNFPYFSVNITEFWRRWHISLSTWLRDYLYIPLGGNRGSTFFTYRNLMITMLLGGLWHGASWNFVIWGGLHGLALVFHREWMKRTGSHEGLTSLMRVPSMLLTFWWVLLAWVFFRAATLSDALTVARAFAFLDSSGTQQVHEGMVTLFIALGVVHWLSYARTFAWHRQVSPNFFYAAYGGAWAVVFALMQMKYRPFIYFQF